MPHYSDPTQQLLARIATALERIAAAVEPSKHLFHSIDPVRPSVICVCGKHRHDATHHQE